jgi:hypothetical protein
MNIRNVLLCTALVITAAPLAHAEKAAKKAPLHDQFSGQGYGTAGCGLGSVIFGQKPGMVQIFASTTNGISGNQTFGISSGTLNCEQTGSQASTTEFIENNRIALQTEAARGQGESLQTLSNLMGCANSTLFSTSVQQNYRTVFPSDAVSSDSVYSAVRQTIRTTPELAKSCGFAG